VTALARLCAYRFPSGAAFEGAIAAALERMETAGEEGLLDALFVTHDVASGDVVAIDMGTATADGTFASLLDFRLDPGRRLAISRRTLADHRRGVPLELIREVEATLDGQAAVLVVLHVGRDDALLDDAVAASGGTALGAEPVGASTLEQARLVLTRLLSG
jgi:hypothetical protein